MINFFINETEVCNLADDISIYSCSLNYKGSSQKISNYMHIVLNWFRINSIIANFGKFHIMFFGSSIDNSNMIFLVENKRVKSSAQKSIPFDDKLNIYKTYKQSMQYGK